MICRSPIDGAVIGQVTESSPLEITAAIERAKHAALKWRLVPAPGRGQLVSKIAEIARRRKSELAAVVTLETGKIPSEAEGEVQEWIDICEFATGLSRQLYGLTIASERSHHRMLEQWHPLGVVGVITAFNFPVAVWAWNSALAAVCGNAVIWKPSEQTPLTAIAVTKIAERVCRANRIDPAIFSLVIGDVATVGNRLVNDRRIALVSATGSTRMGRRVGEAVSRRLGRSLLELGGNNAIIVAPSADMDLAVRAIVFGAVGTAGQRCTSTRRVFAHESILPQLTNRLIKAYEQVRVGNPLEPGPLMGPLIHRRSVGAMQSALKQLQREGGRILYGGEGLRGANHPGGGYVRPCIARARADFQIVHEETFA